MRALLILIPLTCGVLIAEHQSASFYLDDDTFDYEKALSEDDSSDLLHKFLTEEEWGSAEAHNPLLPAKKEKIIEEPGLLIIPTISSYMDIDNEYETDLSTLSQENLKKRADSSHLSLPTESNTPSATYQFDNNDTIVLDLDEEEDENLPYEFIPKDPQDDILQNPENKTPSVDVSNESVVASQAVITKEAVGASHLEQFEESQIAKANQKEAISPSPIPNDSDTIQDYNNPYNNLGPLREPPAPSYEEEPLPPKNYNAPSPVDEQPADNTSSQDDAVSSDSVQTPSAALGRYDDIKFTSNFGTSEDVSTSYQKEPLPAASSEVAAKNTESSSCINSLVVKSFRVTGACHLSTSYLESLIAPYAGQALTFDELQDVAYVITKAYQCRGYPLSRAYLPEQDVTNGSIEIAVIEPTLDSIYIERLGCTRLCDAALRKYLGCVKAGQSINKDDLEYSLLVINDLPGVSSSFSLKPGSSPQTSSLVVRLSEKPLVSGSVEASNYGNRYTGIYLLGARVNVNDLFGYGDLISAQAYYTGEWLQSGRLSYAMPVTSSGLKVGVSAAYTTYTLASVFNVLNATGTAGIYSLFANMPVYLTQKLSLYTYADFDYRQIEDKIQAVSSTANKQMEVLKIGVSGNSSDSWNGLNAFNLGATVGNLNFSEAVAGFDAYTYGSKGVFGKFSLTAQRLQRLGSGFALYGSFAGQLATRNLDGSEQLYLGGPYAVRAYPTGEAPGDTVYLATVELRYSLMSWMHFCANILDEITVKGFFDAGSSLITKLNPSLNSSVDKSRNILGAGLGIDIAKAGFAVINLSWAHKIAGSDAQSNGKNSQQQFWARVEVKF